MAKTTQAGKSFDNLVELIDGISQQVPDQTYRDLMDNLLSVYEIITDGIDHKTKIRMGDNSYYTFNELIEEYNSAVTEARELDEQLDRLREVEAQHYSELIRLRRSVAELEKRNETQSKTIKELIDKPFNKPIVKAIAKPIIKVNTQKSVI